MKLQLILGKNNLKVVDVFHVNDILFYLKERDISAYERTFGINKHHRIGYYKKLSTKEDIYQISSRLKDGIYQLDIIGRMFDGNINDIVGLKNISFLIDKHYAAQFDEKYGFFSGTRKETASNILKSYCILKDRIEKLQ